MITKDPQQVIDLAKNIWFYLAGTIDQGLQFQNDPEERQLNIYTDASFNEVCTDVTWSCGGNPCFFGKVGSNQW